MKTRKMGVSASQIRLWQRCPRLYTDTYVRNLREPEKPAARRGTELHRAIELRLRGQTWAPPDPPEGLPADQIDAWNEDMARVDLYSSDPRFFRLKSKHGEIEADIRIPYDDRIDLIGRIDVLDRKLGMIVDHKSAGSKRYIPTSEQLLEDVQARLYSLVFPAGEAVSLVWVYYMFGKNKPEQISVSATLVSDPAGFRERYGEIIEQIYAARTEQKTGDKQRSGCYTYGRCHRFDACAEPDVSIHRLIRQHRETEKEEVAAVIPKTLYVDCVPVVGPAPVLLENVMAPALATLDKDYCLVDYGKGPGFLRDALREMELPPALAVDTRTKLGADLLQALIPRYELVIRGLR